MNYRHAFHAGNHTEVFKHAALVLIIEHLLAKPQPFMVLDTHSGLGEYDLSSREALRTNEKAEGVERIFNARVSAARGYVELLKKINGDTLQVYPGSPEIIRRLLRPDDRLVACELHPEDAEVLIDRYRHDRRVQAQNRDGYAAVNALLPPRERRGLVFIDPPFEERTEIDSMIRALSIGLAKWATGIFCLWYPIKDGKIGDELSAAAKSGCFPSALRSEFLPYQVDGQTLAGSGLLICNTPWKLNEKIEALCRELQPLLGNKKSRWTVSWINEPV